MTLERECPLCGELNCYCQQAVDRVTPNTDDAERQACPFCGGEDPHPVRLGEVATCWCQLPWTAIAAGSGTAETRSKAQREASQSGGVKQPHRPNTGGHST
jgi:hypothetical protein